MSTINYFRVTISVIIAWCCFQCCTRLMHINAAGATVPRTESSRENKHNLATFPAACQRPRSSYNLIVVVDWGDHVVTGRWSHQQDKYGWQIKGNTNWMCQPRTDTAYGYGSLGVACVTGCWHCAPPPPPTNLPLLPILPSPSPCVHQPHICTVFPLIHDHTCNRPPVKVCLLRSGCVRKVAIVRGRSKYKSSWS